MKRLSITLPGEIVYVYGSVNGETKTWQKKGAAWETTVARSSDGNYHVELTAWDAAGNSAAYTATLSYGLALITDRTQADVNLVLELAARIRARTATPGDIERWLAGLKGAYNASDLNRVERAVRYLTDLLNAYGYALDVQTRDDWTMTDIPQPPEMERYLGNVRTLREAAAILPTTPETPPDWDNPTYIEANAIEQILLDIYFLILNSRMDLIYAGEIFAGDDDT